MPKAAQPEDFLDLDALTFESEPPPFGFRLGGRDWLCRPRGQIPPWLDDQLIAAASNDGSVMLKVSDFFRSVLVKEQVEDFLAVINSPDSPLTQDHLRPLMEQVVAKVLNRPTERPSPSRGGSRRTRATSKAGSSSPGTKASTA